MPLSRATYNNNRYFGHNWRLTGTFRISLSLDQCTYTASREKPHTLSIQDLRHMRNEGEQPSSNNVLNTSHGLASPLKSSWIKYAHSKMNLEGKPNHFLFINRAKVKTGNQRCDCFIMRWEKSKVPWGQDKTRQD